MFNVKKCHKIDCDANKREREQVVYIKIQGINYIK